MLFVVDHFLKHFVVDCDIILLNHIMQTSNLVIFRLLALEELSNSAVAFVGKIEVRGEGRTLRLGGHRLQLWVIDHA